MRNQSDLVIFILPLPPHLFNSLYTELKSSLEPKKNFFFIIFFHTVSVRSTLIFKEILSTRFRLERCRKWKSKKKKLKKKDGR